MSPPPERVPRFTPAERLVHRCTAVAFATLAVTGLALYAEPVVLLVGHRPLVEAIHVVAGLVLPVPVAVAVLGSPAFRDDVTRLGRMGPADAAWLRRRDRRRAGLPVGKFNGGQKLAAATMLGAGLVLLLTGVLLLAPVAVDLPDRYREGATVMHDLFSFGLVVLVAGHTWMAARHPEARAAMRSGFMDGSYAAREHPAWVAEQSGTSGSLR